MKAILRKAILRIGKYPSPQPINASLYRRFFDGPRREVTEISSKLALDDLRFHPELLSQSRGNVNIGTDRRSVAGNGRNVTVSFDGDRNRFDYNALSLDQSIDGIMQLKIPSDELTNGVDLRLLKEIQQAYIKLSTDPVAKKMLIHRMSQEQHKPLAACNVELGELLYGLIDTFKIMEKAVENGIVFERKYLLANGEKPVDIVAGNFPSNFTVYFHPMFEALILGMPAFLCNHPNVPTAANYFIQYIDREVNLNGRLMNGIVGSESDMLEIYRRANQAIFIGDQPTGETIREENPRTYLELSGTNPYVMTYRYFQEDPEKAINELKFNLTYSDGKQCTAPSLLILIGFPTDAAEQLREKLQEFSDELEQVPAPEIDCFGQGKVSFPIAGNPGNIDQFEGKKPFVTGKLPIFETEQIGDAKEVFGLGLGIIQFESLDMLELPNHQLSLGAALSKAEFTSLFDILDKIGPESYPAIVNFGDAASNLAACPTGERFVPSNSTQSGWDIGMGAKSPLRFKSAQVSEKYYAINKDEIDTTIRLPESFKHLLDQVGFPCDMFKAEAYAILQDLKPTLNSRPQGPNEVKIAFEITIGNDKPLYTRLSSSDTVDISNNYVRYALHSILLGKSVIISYPRSFDLSEELKSIIEYDKTNGQLISMVEEDDLSFIKCLDNAPANVLCSDSQLNQRIAVQVNPQFNLVPTNFSPWYMADIFGYFKSFKINVPIDEIPDYGKMLFKRHQLKPGDYPTIESYSTFFESDNQDFQLQIEETVEFAISYNPEITK